MGDQLAIERDKTAVLIMDYQNKQLSGQRLSPEGNNCWKMRTKFWPQREAKAFL
jgi:hypothetical protein